MRARMYDQQRQAIDKAHAAERKSQVGTGDRSERIRTYNYPQSRVTDHRIELTLYNLNDVVNGTALDDFIEGSPIAIARLDASGRIVEGNRAFHTLTKNAVSLPLPFADLIVPARRAEGEAALKRAIGG